MTCDSCAVHVTEALQGIDGVSPARAWGWTSGRAVSLIQPGLNDEQLVEASRSPGTGQSSPCAETSRLSNRQQVGSSI
jgi:copper chaperone CopZ